MTHTRYYSRTAVTLAYLLLGLSVVSTFARMFYGADFIDEAFYAATSYRFALGQVPLIDDVDAHQTAALLMTPYVKAHLAIVGDTTGLLLSLRMVWFALSVGVATLWLTALRKARWGIAAVLSPAATVAVIPYMIPAPSYNTLVIFGLSAGGALIVQGVLAERRRSWVFAASGVCFGVATFAYPTFAVLSFAAIGLIYWITRSRRDTTFFAGGGLSVALLGAAVLLPHAEGLSGVLEGIRALAPVYGWGGAQSSGLAIGLLAKLYSQAYLMLRHPAVWLAIAIAVVQIMRRPVPWWLVMGMMVLVALSPFVIIVDPGYTSELYTFAIAFSALITVSLVTFTGRVSKPQAELQRAVKSIPIVGLGGIVTWTATSGLGWAITAGLGAVLAMPMAVGALIARLDAAMRGRCSDRAREAAHLLGALSIIAAVAVTNWTADSYRDRPPAELTAVVKSGPHAGLRTTRVNAEESEALWTALNRLAPEAGFVLSYHGLPGGYLYTRAKPSSPMLITVDYDAIGAVEATQMIIRGVSARQPDVVIRNRGWPVRRVFEHSAVTGYDPARDGLEAWVSERYEAAESSRRWEILLPRRVNDDS